jgi:hypothetical protein
MVFSKSVQDRTLVLLLGGGEKELHLMYQSMEKQVQLTTITPAYYYRMTRKNASKNIYEAGRMISK